MLFQSTPSAGRATNLQPPGVSARVFQSTPSAWRATLYREVPEGEYEFQSAPSAWRATEQCLAFFSKHVNFNPRPPRGGRRWHVRKNSSCNRFQSAPSAWRATRFPGFKDGVAAISIRALRVEGDSLIFSTAVAGSYFNPRPPRGGRLVLPLPKNLYLFISIRALRVEGDHGEYAGSAALPISIRALRVEGDKKLILRNRYSIIFQSAPSAWRATSYPAKKA